MREERLSEPEFVDSRNEFCITLYNKKIENTATDNQNIETNLVEFCNIPRTRQEIADYLNIKTIAHVMKNYVNPLIKESRLKMTIPSKPRSSKQKFVVEK